MTINKFFMPALVILALFGTIGIAQATGAWVSTGQALVEGKNLTADDLRGWMTIRQAAGGLHLPVETIYQLAGVPAGAAVTPDTPLKQLEGSVPGFDVSALRDKVKAYLAATGEPAPAPAAAQSSAPAPAPAATAPVPATKGSGSGESAPTPLPAGQVLPAAQIKGTMTLKDVSTQCAVPLARILAAANLPANTSPDLQVKTLKDTAPGFEVQTLRDAVAGLQKKP